MVLGAEPTEQTHAEGGFEVTSLPTAPHICVGPGAILADNAFQFHCDFVNSLVPGNSFKTITHTLQRVFEPVGMMLVVRDVHPLPTDIPLTADVFFVSFNFNDAVVFDFQLQTTVLSTKDTACFVNRSHRTSWVIIKL
jgi:hypothetical protein